MRKLNNLRELIENGSSKSYSRGGILQETIESVSPIISDSFISSFADVKGKACVNSFTNEPNLSYSNLNSTICMITDEISGFNYNKIEVIGSLLRSPEQTELVLPWIEEYFRKPPFEQKSWRSLYVPSFTSIL